MITWRLAEPWEVRPLRCLARRSKRSTIECERMALHCLNHAGRSRNGKWFLW